MIRAETATDWILITHPDHAKLAGEVADAWGNAQFAPPESYAPIRYAVYHHDDGWLARDAAPSLTPAGKPEAFTRDLVGAYSAFEEIDLPAYLGVRDRATAAVADIDPVAAIVVSMHTVNLLTEQADVETIQPEHREAHAAFVASQRAWQQKTMEAHQVAPAVMQRGFEFLQCCDNLSLIVCSGYDADRELRHRHPDRDGNLHALTSSMVAPATWRISPWPFRESEVRLELPVRILSKASFGDLESYRTAFAGADVEIRVITLRA